MFELHPGDEAAAERTQRLIVELLDGRVFPEVPPLERHGECVVFVVPQSDER